MATIVDIAQKLNISTSTVSRALCDNEGVSEKTKALVKKTAKEMNYSLNRNAKNLVMQKSYTIGFMIPDISDNFFSKSAYGVEEALSGSKFSLAYTNVQRKEDLILEYLRRAVEYKYDGVFITLDNWTEKIVNQLERMSIPIISLRRKTPEGIQGIPYVDSNHIGGLKQVLKHLIDLGHKDIGFIGFDTTVGNERTRCYISAAEEMNIPVYRVDNYSFHNAQIRISLGYKSAETLLSRYPKLTALVAGDDQLALGALQYAAEHNIQIPRDLSITGYDDRDISNLFCIQLTTARQELFDIGYKAGTMMLDMINNPSLRPENVEIDTKLVIRKTTARCK